MKPRTISMVVEVDNSSTSIAMTESNGNSAQSSTESLLVMGNKTTVVPLIEEPAGSSDVNGNKTMINIRPPPDVHGARTCKHKSWHGNGKASAGVGHGIFTESPPSSHYFPVCHHYSSSSDDVIGQRSRSESCVDDCNEDSEMIPMKRLHRQRSFEREIFTDVTSRNCHSVGDLT